MRKLPLLASALATLLATTSLHVPALGRVLEKGDAGIARQATPAVVNIASWKLRPGPGGHQLPGRIKVHASGFIVDPSGIIVTNKHVIDGAIDMKVIFADGSRAPARVLAAAAMVDIAVLKVDIDHKLPALRWGDSDALQVGDPVMTVGNPLGLGMSVSAGIVSALNRDLGDTTFDSYIQTDASINHGNSGGPLIDQAGDVVGVDTAMYNPDENGGFIGIGFAIPASTAQFVVDHLLDPRHSKPGWIGASLQDLTPELAQALGVHRATGVIVASVEPSGPADQASLRPGDVVSKLDGRAYEDARAFTRAIVKMKVGHSTNLTIWRRGEERQLATRIAEWPNYMPGGGVMSDQAAQSMIARMPDPGLRLTSLTPENREQYGLDAAVNGALVSSVESECEARDLGIVPGDVIIAVQNERVTSPADVRRAVAEAHEQGNPYLAVLVQGKGNARWVALTIGAAGS
jgi:serine protease Do